MLPIGCWMPVSVGAGGVFSVYAEATNLLDTKYYDFVGLIQPPRWITAGVVLTI